MKKILLLLFLSLNSFFVSLTFAQSLELTTTSDSITVDSPFTIQVKANDIPSLDAITIPGLEQLQVL